MNIMECGIRVCTMMRYYILMPYSLRLKPRLDDFVCLGFGKGLSRTDHLRRVFAEVYY